MRTVETNFFNAAPHMEEAGTQAVEEDFAAELAAKLLRPPPTKCKEVEMADTEAFLIAIGIGLTQARHWEQSENAWNYERRQGIKDLTFKGTLH